MKTCYANEDIKSSFVICMCTLHTAFAQVKVDKNLPKGGFGAKPGLRN